jgi:hypothetical protein
MGMGSLSNEVALLSRAHVSDWLVTPLYSNIMWRGGPFCTWETSTNGGVDAVGLW